jgi:hypothetical protein
MNMTTNTTQIKKDQTKVFKGLCKSRVPETVRDDLQTISEAFLFAMSQRFPTYSRALIDRILVPLLMKMQMHRSALVRSVARDVADIINDYCASLPDYLEAYPEMK